jgi:hypothetical protein
LNNGQHECRKKDNGNGKETDKKHHASTHKQITLEIVQKKLESIGIIINVERLMKEE